MQHSQPHIIFYWSVIFLSWGGNILRNVESRMMMLSYASLASISPPYFGGLAMLLCSYQTDNLNNILGTNCGPD